MTSASYCRDPFWLFKGPPAVTPVSHGVWCLILSSTSSYYLACRPSWHCNINPIHSVEGQLKLLTCQKMALSLLNLLYSQMTEYSQSYCIYLYTCIYCIHAYVNHKTWQKYTNLIINTLMQTTEHHNNFHSLLHFWTTADTDPKTDQMIYKNVLSYF